MKYLGEIVKKMLKKNVKIVGCSEAQISLIEESVGGKIPECYREFLRSMGMDTVPDKTQENWYDYAGFTGEDVFFKDDILKLNNELQEQLDEDNRPDLQLLENDFVFFSSQGYIYAFFKLDEGDNPPVYGYEEGYEGNTFPKLTESLQEFYELYLEFGKSPFGNLKG